MSASINSHFLIVLIFLFFASPVYTSFTFLETYDGIHSIRETVQDYGRPNSSGGLGVTLFGLCANLEAAVALAQTKGNKTLAAFFGGSDPQAITDPVTQVATRIADCLYDTCSDSRSPESCSPYCSLNALLNNDMNTLNLNGSMLACARGLCKSPYVLPYADQDVLGVGVAQAYFSISAAIAAFVEEPDKIDPLDGYALMAAVTIGFLCPVFTLLLLQSHNKAEWFDTALAFVAYILNTVIFFMLLANLKGFNRNAAEDGLNQLFEVPSCNGASAMPLCQQLTGTNPLQKLTDFFASKSWANINTVPMLWAWTTFTIILLVGEQVWDTMQQRRMEHSNPVIQDDSTLENVQTGRRHNGLSSNYILTIRPTVIMILISLFSMSLGYEYEMVKNFRVMNVIDMHGWSFGQVVAAMFWIPVFLDVGHSYFGGKLRKRENRRAKSDLEKEKALGDHTQLHNFNAEELERGNNWLRSSSTAPPLLSLR
ncbi:hypothetical protein GQ53DRAFT_761324 [Thozetella sp. PMI_491]|nr:hypothetical protein GQ53DRAFT_761324 [Thozetella sp. PMI_491]